MTAARRRGTALVSLTATTGLLLGAAALGAGPATSAEPAGDCTPAFPVSELKDGDAVTGLTVTKGTEPQEFTGEVLGVYDDGIAPGLDMVMVEIEMPGFEDALIWQGMSGSPVYAADGRLIGAVAYGLSWGPSPVAGVTPFEEMDDYFGADPATRVEVDDRTAAKIARRTDVTRAQASQGFRQLPMPVGISGVSQARVENTEKRAYLRRNVQPVAGSAAAEAGPETIVAGGNLGASLSYGDVNQAGVGTVTSVCDGRVVGFGHPMRFDGRTTMSLHPASAVYVHSDGVSPGFKVANLGAPVGTISQDRLTGITGFLGGLPDTTLISNTTTYGERTREGTTRNTVASAAAGTSFYQVVANHDRVIDAIMPGSETMTWTIEGTDTDGSPFELSFSDRFASDYDITYDVGYDVSDMVWALSKINGVEVTAVTSDSVVSDDSSTYRVRSVQQRRGGAWTPLGKGAPAVVRAGKKLVLRAVLTGPGAVSYVRVTMKVPARAAGSRGQLALTGGNWSWSHQRISSVAQAKKAVAAMTRNDEVEAELTLFTHRKALRKGKVLGPADKVVDGRKRVKVFVR